MVCHVDSNSFYFVLFYFYKPKQAVRGKKTISFLVPPTTTTSCGLASCWNKGNDAEFCSFHIFIAARGMWRLNLPGWMYGMGKISNSYQSIAKALRLWTFSSNSAYCPGASCCLFLHFTLRIQDQKHAFSCSSQYVSPIFSYLKIIRRNGA